MDLQRVENDKKGGKIASKNTFVITLNLLNANVGAGA